MSSDSILSSRCTNYTTSNGLRYTIKYTHKAEISIFNTILDSILDSIFDVFRGKGNCVEFTKSQEISSC